MPSMIRTLREQASHLPLPEHYFSGQLLSEQVTLPDNILMFFHTWPTTRSQTHHRHVLVIPFDHFTYYLDNQQIDVSPGQGMIILPHQRRAASHKEPSCERLYITFEIPGPQPYLPDSPLNMLNEYCFTLIRQTVQAFQTQDVLACALTLAQVLREMSSHPIDVPMKKLSLPVANALRAVSDPSATGMGIKTIADNLGMSPSNLRRVFRQEIGVSLGRYIRNHRIEMARHDLRCTNLSIGQIAERCGYSSIYAFSHAFKNVVRESPQRYRRLHREIDIRHTPNDGDTKQIRND